ncbi:unnamed protein product [Ambrosiozyma monospora]|uniref:Unnamed protein product n=1 Tax=Ambrosiozyma monospora TaxID=43982 RepID=A0ACB5TCH3_AMBMO|nr:unnamed protein product [Ambrosiozyma monospora]
MGAVFSCLIPQSDTSSHIDSNENAPLLSYDENENNFFKSQIREIELRTVLSSVFDQLVDIAGFHSEEQQIQQTGFTLEQHQDLLMNSSSQSTDQEIMQQQPNVQSNMPYGAAVANNSIVNSIQSPIGNNSDYDDLVDQTVMTLTDKINVNVLDESLISEELNEEYPKQLNKAKQFLARKSNETPIKVTSFMDY